MRPAVRAIRGVISSSPARSLLPTLASSSSTSIPEGPSCSRWFSCTCCHQNIPAKTYFTPHTPHTPHQLSSQTLEDTPEENSFPILPSRSSKPFHPGNNKLPLPPRLPYSPDSVPFKRHLNALSLSIISGTPDESWYIYLSLHHTLRRYIPDNLYKDLLAHQCTEPLPKQRWQRTLALIKFGRSCGFGIWDIPIHTVEMALKDGLIYMIKRVERLESISNKNLLVDWWICSKKRYRDDLGKMPLGIRINWLRYWQLRHYTFKGRKEHDRTLDDFVEKVKEIVDYGGGVGMEKSIMYESIEVAGPRSLEKVLEMIVYCWMKGVEVPIDAGMNLLERMDEDIARASRILEKLKVEYGPLQMLEQLEKEYIALSRKPDTKAMDALQNDATAPHLIRRAMDLLKDEASENNIKIALEICIAILSRNHDAAVLITKLSQSLITYPSYEIDRLSFLTSIKDHTNLPSIALACLFRIAVDLIPPSRRNETKENDRETIEEGYNQARKLYPLARKSGWKWTRKDLQLWKILFNYTVSTKKQLHFAGRLYTDLMADNIDVPTGEALEMIEGIGKSRSVAKHILLERHVRDYIWKNNVGGGEEGMNGKMDDFVVALAEGARSAEEALGALALIRRIYADISMATSSDNSTPTAITKELSLKLPSKASKHLAIALARSPSPKHFQTCRALLSHCNCDLKTYNDVMTSIQHLAKKDLSTPNEIHLSTQESAGRIITIYRDASSRSIQPDKIMVSILLRTLLDLGNIDSAISMWKAANEKKMQLRSDTIGRLIIAVAHRGNLDTAETVEKEWRELGVGQWDKGIVGAKVYVDILRGREVDYDELEKKTGWKPSLSFRKFLEEQKELVKCAGYNPVTPTSTSTAIPGVEEGASPVGNEKVEEEEVISDDFLEQQHVQKT